jgi:hypothetical protein
MGASSSRRTYCGKAYKTLVGYYDEGNVWLQSVPIFSRRSGATPVRRRVGQQRHVSRVLQRDPQAALVARAGAGLTSWLDLAAIGEIAVQTRDIFIVDLDHVIDTERADLTPTRPASTATEAPAATIAEPRSIAAIAKS